MYRTATPCPTSAELDALERAAIGVPPGAPPPCICREPPGHDGPHRCSYCAGEADILGLSGGMDGAVGVLESGVLTPAQEQQIINDSITLATENASLRQANQDLLYLVRDLRMTLEGALGRYQSSRRYVNDNYYWIEWVLRRAAIALGGVVA